MRTTARSVLASALVALLIGPTAAAQLPGTLLAEDAADDWNIHVADAADLPGLARTQYGDLLGLSALENATSIEVWLQVASLEPPAGATVAVVDDVVWRIGFAHSGVDYRVTIFGGVNLLDPTSPPTYNAYLARAPPDSFFDVVDDSGIKLDADQEAGVFHVTIPRDAITDLDGAHPLPGDVLDGWYAFTRGTFVELAAAYPNVVLSLAETGIHHEDYLPDEGFAPVTLAIELGVNQTGHIAAFSERPFRASNGEATTFLYEVDLTNEADYADSVQFSTEEAPAGWVITFPEETVRLLAGETVTVPVLATVPFKHDHGSRDAFRLVAQSHADPLATSAVELGVLYTAVPQPAGHHHEAFLHTANNNTATLGGSMYFNTLQQDAADTQSPSYPDYGAVGLPMGMTWVWEVPLQPGLRIGMDWDLDAEGSISVPVQTLVPTAGAELSGRIYLFSAGETFSFTDDETIEVATITGTGPVAIGANAQATLEGTITPTEQGDYWPFVEGFNLWLDIEVTFPDHVTAGLFGDLVVKPASIQPGGTLNLPLEEFHDDVDQYFQALSGVELLAITPQQKQVNPAETVVFEVRAKNIGTETRTYELELTGANTDWAHIVGSTRIQLLPNEVRTLAVSVNAPADARDGTLADVTLHARDALDPNVRSLIRFLAEVVAPDVAEVDDEAEKVAQLEEELTDAEPTPSPGWLPLAALAATAFLARRRPRPPIA